MLPSIDWNLFHAKLTVIALKWFRDEGYYGLESVLKGVGVSAKDLAQTAALELFKNAHKYDFNEEQQCFSLAVTIMRRDFLDFIKKGSYKKTDSGELPDEVNTKCELNETLVANKFYDLAKGDQNLIDFIDAVIFLKTYKREDVADLLCISKQEVTNLQRVLRDRASNNKSLAEFQKA